MPDSHQAMVHAAFSMASRRSELRRLLRQVDDFAHRNDLPAQAWFCARLALEEIISNLLKYAYPEKTEHMIVIRVALHPRELALRIEDDGQRFNPLEHIQDKSNEGVENKAQGGHGLLLVKSLMDEFKYHRYWRKNIVTLKKRIN
ncbi:MAG: ATP-binding protein [bacterium]